MLLMKTQDDKLTDMQLTFENWLTVTCSISGLLGSLMNAFVATKLVQVIDGSFLVFVYFVDSDSFQLNSKLKMTAQSSRVVRFVLLAATIVNSNSKLLLDL